MKIILEKRHLSVLEIITECLLFDWFRCSAELKGDIALVVTVDDEAFLCLKKWQHLNIVPYMVWQSKGKGSKLTFGRC